MKQRVHDGPTEGKLVYYFLVPRFPLSVPHGTTFNVAVDEEMPEMSISPAPGVPSKSNHGKNFVSLKFWQHKGEGTDGPSTQAQQAVNHVVDAHLNIDRREAARRTTETQDNMIHTVIEAVTYVAERESLDPESKDPLTRCIDVVLDYHRAYRLALQSKTIELTYQMLYPVVIQIDRTLDGDSPPEVVALNLLDHTNFPGQLDEDLDHDRHLDLARHLTRIHRADPAMLFLERQLDAMVETHTQGRSAEGIVQAAIAAEVLFGGVMALMLWEEYGNGRTTKEQAAQIISKDLTSRLKQDYSGRLGGSWTLTGQNLYLWHSDVAVVRNRVVHAGFRPSPKAADDALVALAHIRGFVCDRLAERFARYPRTAWIYLGHAGLEKREKLRRAENWLAGNAVEDLHGSILTWLAEYGEWRAEIDSVIAAARES